MTFSFMPIELSLFNQPIIIYLLNAQVEVTEGNAEEVAIFLKNRTQDNSAVGDEEVEVEDVADILIKIADAGSGNPEVEFW